MGTVIRTRATPWMLSEFGAVTPPAKLLFLWSLFVADDEGKLHYTNSDLEQQLAGGEVEQVVRELESGRLWVVYEANGKQCVFVPQHLQFRRIERQTCSEIPDPPEDMVAQWANKANEDQLALFARPKDLRIAKAVKTTQTEDCRTIFNYWREKMHPDTRSRVVFSGHRQKAVLARLNEGYTMEDMFKAIDGCYTSDFHMKRGQWSHHPHPYNDLTLIFRDGSKLEQFRQRATEQTTTPYGLDLD